MRPSRIRVRPLVATVLGMLLLVPIALPAVAQDASPAPAPVLADTTTEGGALATRFMEILGLPDADKATELDGFLADEFQLVRANGTWADKAAYVANPATVHSFRVDSPVVTQAGDVVVVSFVLETTETIDGVEQTNHAPRLSVFHWNGVQWQLAAHSNFGVTDAPAPTPSPSAAPA